MFRIEMNTKHYEKLNQAQQIQVDAHSLETTGNNHSNIKLTSNWKSENKQTLKKSFSQEYGFKIAIVVVFILIVILTYENFLISQKNSLIKQLLQTRVELQCLEQKLMTKNFTKCGDAMQKKIKNPDPFRPVLMREPHLTKLKIENQTKILEISNNITSKVQFGAQLFLNWKENNQDLFQVEYYRLNMEYGLEKPVPEKRMCIMAPFRNLLKHGLEQSSMHMFMHSVNQQNYSKYHVYMIDDASNDNSTEAILKQLPKYPRLNNRITLLRNNQSYGALANRDSVTRRYCRPGDIVMDIDGDDALIGKQVFNMLNRMYHNNPQAWFVYTNFVQVKGSNEGDGRNIEIDINKAEKGPSQKIKPELFEKNSYRTNLHDWVTSQIRSYLYELYVKIPLNYLIDKETGEYHIKASDRFVMYALVQLAGAEHTFFFEEYSYFYYQPNFRVIEKLDCSLPVIFYNEAKSRVLTPLRSLNSLDDTVETVSNYQVPVYILQYKMKMQLKLLSCQEKARKDQIDETI